LVIRVALAILLLGVTGCTSRYKVAPTIERRKEDLLRGISRSNERLRSLRGRGRIAVSTGGRTYSGNFSLLYRSPEKLRIDVNGPFGIQLLSVTSVEDSVLAVMPLADIAYVSRASSPGVGGLGEVVTAGDLMELATATVTVAGTLLPEKVSLEHNDGSDVLVYEDSGYTKRITVNARTGATVARSTHDKADRLVLQCDYGRFKLTEGMLRPYVVKIREVESDNRLEMVYEHQSLNGRMDDREFHLEIPRGVEIIQDK
jgi:outer membrane lipoprotein-sorting protein